MRTLVVCCWGLALAAIAHSAVTPEDLAKVPGVTVVSNAAAYRVLEPWEVPHGAGLVDGPFGFRVDNQCTGYGANFCCQLDVVDGCVDENGQPINGGPYYAREFTDFNDFVRTNLYWSEHFPEDMPDSECESVRRTNSSALLPRLRPDKALFSLLRDEANFGNLCDHRGETVTFCRSSAFFLRPSLEDEMLPWAFTLEGRFGALDWPGFDITAFEHCVP